MPKFESLGTPTSTIDVRISNRIVELFSEGLYSSPNKAIEELVSNSFDAGANHVHVILAPDLSDPEATISVLDDGTGMDEKGLRQHWVIGASLKRKPKATTPGGRRPIGKFGIGKLATYVLANKLTHITKVNKKYYAATMDYAEIESADTDEVFSDAKIDMPLRALTEAQAKEAVAVWISGDQPGFKAMRLFGEGSAPSWTVAILSELKELASEIRLGLLRWVLQTAMPLRDDFQLFLDGQAVKPSKLSLEKVQTWTLGKDIKSLSKLDGFTASEDKTHPKTSSTRFGLTHPGLGRLTGYADLYKDLLTTGKSADIERSHGFFVYVRDRLVNLTDEYFGIDRNLLRHGTFSRFRMVVHIDGLDSLLRSSREALREGPQIETTRDLLKAVFNIARASLELHEESLLSGARLGSRVADTPASLTSQPILGLLSAAFEDKITPKYITYPGNLDSDEKAELIDTLKERVESKQGMLRGVELIDLGQDQGMAVYNVDTAVLQINTLHPFVAYFLDDFEDAKRNLPLDLIAMSEVLAEAQLFQASGDESLVKAVMDRRDNLLRYLARSTGKRNAFMIARDLQDASTSKVKLEAELVAAFNSMGFEAVPLGGPKKPDGIADAHLSAGVNGQRRTYKVSLEAKSKEKEGTKVSAKTVGVSGIARQRTAYGADHAVVVGPDFPTTQEDKAALVNEIDSDREQTGKTITLVRISDLARLVKIVPLKRIGLEKLRELFLTCRTPEESKKFIDKLASQTSKQPPYKEILETIWQTQKEVPGELVEYGDITTSLRKEKSINLSKAEVKELAKALSTLAGDYVFAQANAVELTQKPSIVMKAIGSAIQQFDSEREFSAGFTV